jgi:hypothetical protein
MNDRLAMNNERRATGISRESIQAFLKEYQEYFSQMDGFRGCYPTAEGEIPWLTNPFWVALHKNRHFRKFVEWAEGSKDTPQRNEPGRWCYTVYSIAEIYCGYFQIEAEAADLSNPQSAYAAAPSERKQIAKLVWQLQDALRSTRGLIAPSWIQFPLEENLDVFARFLEGGKLPAVAVRGAQAPAREFLIKRLIVTAHHFQMAFEAYGYQLTITAESIGHLARVVTPVDIKVIQRFLRQMEPELHVDRRHTDALAHYLLALSGSQPTTGCADDTRS